MAKISKFKGRDNLLRRETIEIELPRFLVRVFESEVAKANADASGDERVTLNDYIELHLAEFLSIADVANLEREIPGIGGAVWNWLEEIRDNG